MVREDFYTPLSNSLLERENLQPYLDLFDFNDFLKFDHNKKAPFGAFLLLNDV